MPMRIGVYLGRHKGAGGGIGVFCRSYVLALLKGLESRTRESDEIVLYGDASVLNEELLEELELSPVLNVTASRGVPFGASWYFRTLANGAQYRILVRKFSGAKNHRLRTVLDQFILPLYALVDGLSALHMMSNIGLFFCPVPQIVTVHDLFQAWPPEDSEIPLRRGLIPKLFRGFYRTLFKRQFVSAAHICSDTEEVRAEIRRRFPSSQANCQAIELGVDTTILGFLSIEKASRDERVASWIKSRTLPESYVFAFASLDPRKNFFRTIEAWKLFAAEHSAYSLVVLCPLKRERKLLLAALDGSERVIAIDWLPREEFPLALAGASAVLVPTLAEGFGLPAIESAALGTAVVTSRLSALERYEDQENLFYYCDARDTSSIAESLLKAVSPSDGRKSITPRTMSECFEDYWGVYQNVVLQAGR